MDTETPYDVYFYYPVRILENDKVRLTPYIVSYNLTATAAGLEV